MGTYTGTLDFAIQREEQAHNFYLTLARSARTEEMRRALLRFAEEELKHKAILSAMKGQKAKPPEEDIRELRIGDYATAVEPTPHMSYEEALAVAVKKEADSFRLYRDLAAITVDEDLRNTFLTLAREEARHRQHFERERQQAASNDGQ